MTFFRFPYLIDHCPEPFHIPKYVFILIAVISQVLEFAAAITKIIYTPVYAPIIKVNLHHNSDHPLSDDDAENSFGISRSGAGRQAPRLRDQLGLEILEISWDVVDINPFKDFQENTLLKYAHMTLRNVLPFNVTYPLRFLQVLIQNKMEKFNEEKLTAKSSGLWMKWLGFMVVTVELSGYFCFLPGTVQILYSMILFCIGGFMIILLVFKDADDYSVLLFFLLGILEGFTWCSVGYFNNCIFAAIYFAMFVPLFAYAALWSTAILLFSSGMLIFLLVHIICCQCDGRNWCEQICFIIAFPPVAFTMISVWTWIIWSGVAVFGLLLGSVHYYYEISFKW